MLQDARHQRPRDHPGRRYQQETGTDTHHGGDLPDHALQLFCPEADRGLQQPHQDHLQSRARLFHGRYYRAICLPAASITARKSAIMNSEQPSLILGPVLLFFSLNSTVFFVARAHTRTRSRILLLFKQVRVEEAGLFGNRDDRARMGKPAPRISPVHAALYSLSLYSVPRRVVQRVVPLADS